MLAKEKGTRAISLRVSIADIDAAKEIAGNGEGDRRQRRSPVSDCAHRAYSVLLEETRRLIFSQ